MDVTVLPVAPWTLFALSLVVLVALSVPAGGPHDAPLRTRRPALAGRLWAALALALALAAAAVARFGPASELDNPVPAAIVGLGWPLLLVLPTLVGLLRPRGIHEDAGDIAGDNVRPAVLGAAAIVMFLTLPDSSTATMTVGYAVAAYTTVVVAFTVAFGRAAVAARFEVLGLLAQWAALGRGLPGWAAPRGALAVLTVLLGGAWFERYERTTAWAQDLPDRQRAVAGLAVAVALAAAGAVLLRRAVRVGAPGTAAAALLPLVLATTVAGVLRRALISVQLLLDQAGGARPVDPDPLGVAGGQSLALGLVALGGALSAAVLARRMGDQTARLPGVGVLLLLTGVSAWVVLQP